MLLMIKILGRSIHTIKKNTEALVVISKENGLEVNADKTKYSKTCLKWTPYIPETWTSGK